MTRVWSMMSQEIDPHDCAQIQNSITLRGHHLPLRPRPSSSGPPLPPDTDSGYEASPSSATRMISFQFNGIQSEAGPSFAQTNNNLEEELLSIDLFTPMLLEEEEIDMQSDNNDVFEDAADEEKDGEEYGNGLRAESSNSGSSGSERLMSTPIPIPTASSRLVRSVNTIDGSETHLSLTPPFGQSPSSLGHNMIVAVDDDDRFSRGVMFAHNNWSRYHIALSPHSPPSTYWSPHLIGFVTARNGQMPHNHNNNHYRRMAINESLSSESSMPSHDLSDLSPIPRTSYSFTSHMSPRSELSSVIVSPDQHDDRPQLPDVVNVRLRHRMGNGHAHGQRSASICLPIDRETVRTVGMSLRRISEEFVFRRSREMLSTNSEPGVVIRNVFASVGMSRRSLSSRFRSNHIHINGRPRSYSSNDADDADAVEE